MDDLIGELAPAPASEPVRYGRPKGRRTVMWKMLSFRREKRAAEMRLAGRSVQEIARELGCSSGSAKEMLARAMRRQRQLTEHAIDELRATEIARLDKYLATLEFRIAMGDDKAIDAALKISKRRAELLGLDAPVKIASTDADGKTSQGPAALALVFVQPAAQHQLPAPPVLEREVNPLMPKFVAR